MSRDNKLHYGHRDRVRQRFMKFGAEPFHPHELMELVLFYCIPRKDTNEIAHYLMDRFGSVNGILNASHNELKQVGGIGASAADFLHFLGDVTRDGKPVFSDVHFPVLPEEQPDFFRERFAEASADSCLIASPGNVCVAEFTRSSVFDETINISGMIEMFLKYECSGVVIGINKTTGAAIPGQEDIRLVEYFRKKFGRLGIEVLDCLIIGKKRSFSLMYDGAFLY